MKLPKPVQLGVQSLGREDVAAPGAVARAKAAEADAWTGVFDKATNAIVEIETRQNEADAELALSERITQDRKFIGETKAWMESNPVIDLSRNDIPDNVRKEAEMYAKVNKITDGRINTSDVIVAVTEQTFRATRDDSHNILKDHVGDEKLRARYNAALTDTWTNGAIDSVRTQATQRMDALRANAEVQLNAAISARDEEQAIKIITDSEQNGIWMPAEAGKKLSAVRSTIDYMKANDMLMGATTQHQIDNAEDYIDTSRVTPEQRVTLNKLSVQRQNHMHTMSTREQAVNYGEGQRLLTQNKLSKDWIVDMLGKQKISGAHANTLRNALDKPSPLVSDPYIVDSLKRKIVSLRYPQPGDDPATTTQRAAEVRKEVFGAFTGTGPRGEELAKKLTADDFDDLTKLIDEYENTALGKGGQQYQTAVRTIKALTGYSDVVSAMVGGKYPQGEAYAAFTTELQAYMDQEGANARPMEFIQANKARFSADVYDKQLEARLGAQFPQYRTLIEGDDISRLVGQIALDHNSGKLPTRDRDFIMRSIQYRTIDYSKLGVSAMPTGTDTTTVPAPQGGEFR